MSPSLPWDLPKQSVKVAKKKVLISVYPRSSADSF